MAHGYAIVKGYRIEFGRKTAQMLNLRFNHLTRFMQVGMSGNKLREGIGDGNDGLTKMTLLHAIGTPQAPGTGALPAFSSLSAS